MNYSTTKIVFFIILGIFVFGIFFYVLVKSNRLHKNQTKCNFEYHKTIFINYSILFFVILLNLFRLHFNLKAYSLVVSPFKIMIAFVIIDFMFYCYHITLHRHSILKEWIHSTHHNSVKLVPLDSLYLSVAEQLIGILSLYIIPNIILGFNLLEIIIVYGIVICHNAYLHSETEKDFMFRFFINSEYHLMHHNIGGGNYAQVFSMWDDIMGTRITEDKIKKYKRDLCKKNKIRKKNKNIKTKKSNEYSK